MDKLRSKFCFQIHNSSTFHLLPIIKNPIVHQGEGSGGWGILLFNKLFIIRRPESNRQIPFIVK